MPSCKPGTSNPDSFAIRPSELSSTATGDVYLGVVVEAAAGSGFAPALPTIAGLTPIASRVQGDQAFALFRVDAAGLELLQISGADSATSGGYTLSLFVAGDVNHDGLVDGLDSQALSAAFGKSTGEDGFNLAADFNRDGHVDSVDRQLLSQGYGYRANQAPTVQASTAKTHVDLDVDVAVQTFISDLEGDQTYYRITGATHGTATLSGDGQFVIFKPETGYTGPASFSIVADDGYSQSATATVNVNVSDAKLLRLNLTRFNSLVVGSDTQLQLTGDFSDQLAVVLPASYVTFTTSDGTVATIDATGRVRAVSDGTALIHASSHGIQAVNAFTAYTVQLSDLSEDVELPDFGELDPGVYPGTLTLVAGGGQRQLRITDVYGTDLTVAESGTQYIVSNPEVAIVTPDGLITALATGRTTVNIVNGGGQTNIELNVEVPHVGATTLNAAIGGAVQSATGELLLVGPGVLPKDTQVSITRLDISQLTLAPPPAADFNTLAAFQVDVGQESLNAPVQMAIPVGTQVQAGTEVFFLRRGTITDELGVVHDTWWLLDNGFVGADGIARTASPPYPGFSSSGEVVIVSKTNRDPSTGALTIQGHYVATWSPQHKMASWGSHLFPQFQGLFDSFAGTAFVYTYAGAYNVADFAKDGSPGDKVITVSAPTIPPAPESPIITQVSIGNQQLTISGANFGVGSGTVEIWLHGAGAAEANAVIESQDNPVPVPANGLVNYKFVRAGGAASYTIDVPMGVALGLHEVSIVVKAPGVDDQGNSTSQQVAFTSSVRVRGYDDLTLVAQTVGDKNEVKFLRGKSLVKTIDFVNQPTAGQSYDLSDKLLLGYKTDQIAFLNSDIAFIAGSKGKIAMIDMATLEFVRTIQVDGSSDNISSIAVANGWLYVAEGGRGAADDSSHRLLRINVDPRSDGFLTEQQQLLTFPSAPQGYFDLAVSNGRYLAVTAPTQAIKLQGYDANKGNVFVIDLNQIHLPADGSAAIVQAITADVSGNGGKGPQYIQAAGQAGQFVLSNALDHNAGFVALSFGIDAKTGNLNGDYTADTPKLVPSATNYDWLQKKFQQNIQRAHEVVVTTVGDHQYAFVADYNLVFNDPHFSAGTLIEKQIGGKIGIIRDPFGDNVYLGATTPIVGGLLDHLALGPDGKTLYASLFSADGDLQPNGLLVFDVAELIASALANPDRTVPVDYDPVTEGPKTGVAPDKFNVGYVRGVEAPSIQAAPVQRTLLYGDVTAIDLRAVILAMPGFADLSAKSITNINVQPRAFQGAKVATDKGSVLSTATLEQLSTQDNVNSSGILYLVPEITDAELTALRNGNRLPDKQYSGIFTAEIGQQIYTFELRGTITDFGGDSRGRVFFGDRALDNPGYSEFKLRGTVQVGSANDPLDVYRVEQRLRYLGFPAFDNPAANFYTASGIPNLRTPLEFDVNGTFGDEEQSALRVFYAGTHLEKTAVGSSLATGRRDFNWGIDDVISNTAAIVDAARSVAPGSDNLAWLNAYNAPHWVNVYDSLGIPLGGTGGSFVDNQNVKEIYSTSWTRDLLVALERQQGALATVGLSTSLFQINGLTDPGYGAVGASGNTIHNTGNHSIGMGFDLGLGQWIKGRNQNSEDADGIAGGNNPTINFSAISGSAWSVTRASQVAGLLPGPEPDGTSKNNQQQALRDFLTLYAVTQDDGTRGNGIGWDDLPVSNGTGDQVRTALFGAGNQMDGLIAHVLVGDSDKNPYTDIHSALARLNITAQQASGHKDHFHITLQAPDLQGIAANLVADVPALGNTDTEGGEALQAAAQVLLQQFQPQLSFSFTEEITMFVVDVPPEVPAQYAPVVIVQSVPLGGIDSVDRTIGVCHLIENPTIQPGSAENVISPIGTTHDYLKKIEKREVGLMGTVTLLQRPNHGELIDAGGGDFRYNPVSGYFGLDSATILVEVGGIRVKMIYAFNVREFIPGGTEGYDPYDDKNYCPKGEVWEISATVIDDSFSGLGNLTPFTPYVLNNFVVTLDFEALVGNEVGKA